VINWDAGMSIPSRTSGSETTVTTDADGNIPIGTIAWSLPAIGKYDIVVDVNGDGKYNPCVDALDDCDVEITAGLHVIPEVPLGTVTALATALAALIVYKKRAAIKK
jgi:diacylglycerol kinase family enzyme